MIFAVRLLIEKADHMNEFRLMHKKIYSLLWLTIAIFIFSACATKKRKGDVGPVKKFYHDVTSEYNGYYNATVLMDETKQSLIDQYQENYNKILPIFPYIETDDPKANAANLDKAIEKVAVVVTVHRVSHWTDDCYLLMGQAQYMKQEFEDAEETLEYMMEEFSPEAIAKKKKKLKKNAKKKKKKVSKRKRKKLAKKRRKEQQKKRKAAEKARKKARKSGKKAPTAAEKKAKRDAEKKLAEAEKKKKEEKEEKEDNQNGPDNYFLKHRPCYQDAQLWLARTYIERQSFAEADRLFTLLETNPKTFDHIRRDLHAVKAHYWMKQQNYSRAMAPLAKAVEVTKNKTEKARYAYILAQLHQQAGDSGQAFAYFEKAKKYSNNYDMVFNAQMSMAKNEYSTGKVSTETAVRRLKRMLKDAKNEEYLDQIYFTLAEISLEGKQKEEAVAYLKSSLLYSKGNKIQQSESYLMLANFYFEDEDYVEAKNYFDSTLTVLPKNDERYTEAEAYRDNLKDIAENIQIIQTQDSLIRIAQMSPSEKTAFAYNLKKKQDEAKIKDLLKNKDKPEKFDKRNPGGTRKINTNRRNNVTPSTFFAYNEKSAKKGLKDFKKRFGDRPLEDNWRRSNRQSTGEINEDIAVADEAESVLTPEEVKKILGDVPESAEEIQKANDMIQQAMFTLGTLYRDRLDNHPKTVNTLEGLLGRYPKTKFQPEAWYYLHLAYADMNNSVKAREYQDLLVQSHPDNKYARALGDPNFMSDYERDKVMLDNYYRATFAAYEEGNYQLVYDRVEKANKEFPGSKNTIPAKFELLKAMANGNLKGKEAYIKGLKDVIAKYPDSAEERRAKEILRLIGDNSIAGGGRQIGKKVKKDSKNRRAKNGESNIADDKTHYFIIVIEEESIQLADAKADVANYNRQYHKQDRLRISNIYLGSETRTPILVVRSFSNKEKALDYYNGVLQNKANFLSPGANYELFAVTQHNYRQILKNKSVEDYRSFFQEHYVQ